MKQFYDPPAFTTSKNINKIFANTEDHSTQQNSKYAFVPFSQERDHLGRLLSGDKLKPPTRTTRESTQLKNQNQSRLKKKEKNRIGCQMTHAEVDKKFRLTRIAEKRPSTEIKRMRILSTGSSKAFPAPSVGYYDTANITDKIKYSKSKSIAFSRTRRSQTMQSGGRKQVKGENRRTIIYDQAETEPCSKSSQAKKQAGLINYNLPELQKYLEMRRLKLNFYENFEESHQKFKELAESSKHLARKMKEHLSYL